MRSVALLLGAATAVQARLFDYFPREHRSDDLPPIPALTKRGQQSNEPCAQVADLWTTQQKKNASATVQVPAQLAYKCLQTVPVDVDGDVQEISELKDYLQYQSTLAWLKKGGADGQSKPIDLMANLDSIASNVKNGKYKNDFDVQIDIRSLLDSTGDFHLAYIPDITEVFRWVRPDLTLVSVSDDGLKLPTIFTENDLLFGKTPSAIVSINGKNASDFVSQIAGNSYHDADARYNNVVENPALKAQGGSNGGLFRYNYLYMDASTNLTFANGTSKTIDNVAYIDSTADFTNVTDGPSFFQQFCVPSESMDTDTDTDESDDESEYLEQRAVTTSSATPVSTSSSGKASSTTASLKSSSTTASLKSSSSALLPKPSNATASRTATSTSMPKATMSAYPSPVFINDDATFSGYYLNDSNYNDVAVIAVPGFEPKAVNYSGIADSSLGGFKQTQDLLRKFFADAAKQNKKKLIIDLRGNGGGQIDVGFEFFRQLFPTIEPYGGARYRAHEAFHYFEAVLADVAVNGSNVHDLPDDDLDSPFLWSNILDENDKPYKSFSDYWGPITIQNDTFTGIRRYNFSDSEGHWSSGANLTGYNGQSAPAQPFTANNIILLQDGLCGSTCAIFSELMREQAKVQSIAIGGRPQNSPMQTVGGSKGAQVLMLDSIFEFANYTLQAAYQLNGDDVVEMLNETIVGRIAYSSQLAARSYSGGSSMIAGGVNSLNNERQNDTTHTPLEFVYEAADCRIFYTKTTYSDVTSLWKSTVDTTWKGGKCVTGSTGDKSSIGTINNQPWGTTNQQVSSPSSTPPSRPQSAAPGLGVSSLFTVFAAVMAVAFAI